MNNDDIIYRFTKISELILDIIKNTQFLKSVKIPDMESSLRPVSIKIKKDFSIIDNLIINFAVDSFGSVNITLTFNIRGVPSTEVAIIASNNYFEIYVPRALVNEDEIYNEVIRSLEKHKKEISEALDKMVLKNLI